VKKDEDRLTDIEIFEKELKYPELDKEVKKAQRKALQLTSRPPAATTDSDEDVDLEANDRRKKYFLSDIFGRKSKCKRPATAAGQA
jgi:hypothetical protein